jgi:hypothetical protein
MFYHENVHKLIVNYLGYSIVITTFQGYRVIVYIYESKAMKSNDRVFLTNLNFKIFYHIIGPFMGGGSRLNVQTKPGGRNLSPHRSRPRRWRGWSAYRFILK